MWIHAPEGGHSKILAGLAEGPEFRLPESMYNLTWYSICNLRTLTVSWKPQQENLKGHRPVSLTFSAVTSWGLCFQKGGRLSSDLHMHAVVCVLTHMNTQRHARVIVCMCMCVREMGAEIKRKDLSRSLKVLKFE